MSSFDPDTVSERSQTKIVYFINSLHVGGAEIGMCRLLNGLNPSQYEVTVVALDGHSEEIISQLPSWVKVVDLRVRSGIGMKTIKELYSIVRTANVIVGSLFHSSMVARGAKMANRSATIVTWHHANQFKSNFRQFTFRRTAWLSDVVLADSEPVAEMLVSDLGLDANLVHTVPIAGIDIEEYTPVVHRNKDEILVGSVGRLSEQKNYSAVLDIAERLDETNIRFEIAGGGELFEELQTEIEERDLTNVTLRGFVDDIPTFLANLDIYVQPSRWEGLCITVLEAMAARLPVVGSNVGGIGRNVEEGVSGYLYKPDDVAGFASGIETLAKDSELRQQFGEHGREIVREEFTQEVLVKEFKRAIGPTQRS